MACYGMLLLNNWDNIPGIMWLDGESWSLRRMEYEVGSWIDCRIGMPFRRVPPTSPHLLHLSISIILNIHPSLLPSHSALAPAVAVAVLIGWVIDIWFTFLVSYPSYWLLTYQGRIEYENFLYPNHISSHMKALWQVCNEAPMWITL